MIIFSDEPDAAEKLGDKIERLKKRQGVMKRANHLIRKADREGLADLGFSEETIAKLFVQLRSRRSPRRRTPHRNRVAFAIKNIAE